MFLFELFDGVRHRGRMRRWTPDQAAGRRGEDIAHRFLERAGLVIVGRNYRMESGAGEIDLVGWEGSTLVFIEVKTRQSDQYGPPDRAIGADKLRTITRAARQYARHAGATWENVRFDIVNVLLQTPPVVTHFRDVLTVHQAV
jgi:putative endonuclease